MRIIKTRGKWTKEGLIINLLKSESSDAEHNYMKHFNSNTDDADSNDDKIRGKISDIKMMVSALGNTVTNNDRKKVRTERYEIKKAKSFR